MKRALVAAMLVFGLVPAVHGHEVRPAYLELEQVAAEEWNALWKVPGRGDDLRLGLSVEVPTTCVPLARPRGAMVDHAFIERWRMRCQGGLAGTIRIAGLSGTSTDVLARLLRLDGTTQVVRLTPASPSFVVTSRANVLEVAGTYFSLGLEHILSGADHLLFVFALLLITGATGRLITTITAFTIAHSITLAAATVGVVHVPQAPVEATIALSIAFVAAEIVHLQRGVVRITVRAPWVIAFAFGLLHGFGFSGALGEIGLPQASVPAALLFFNLGVEAGQLAFVAVALAVLEAARRRHLGFPAWAQFVPAYAIGSVAMLWVIQRLALF